LHPSDFGHAVIGQKLAIELRKILQKNQKT
jgi:hypothetical protein